VVGQAVDGEDAFEFSKNILPDVLELEIIMSG
jgi:chemotaxis response regulator CheB